MLNHWKNMSIDELFELHQLMQSVLRDRATAKKDVLESRRRILNQMSDDGPGTDQHS